MSCIFYSLVQVWKQFFRIFPISWGRSDLTAIELPQHAVGRQQVQAQRRHMLKAAGRLIPQLGIVAFQRELAAHHAQQVGDQAQLVGKRGVQQKVCRGLEALDIPRP